MKEIQGNIWDYHDKGYWIVITTNGTVRKDGACVMGRGVALEAKQRFPKFPFELGKRIREDGNIPHHFYNYSLISLPVKHSWYERADLVLIESSVKSLVKVCSNFLSAREREVVCMVRPGCGNGGLDWKDVKPILEHWLDDKFIVVQK